ATRLFTRPCTILVICAACALLLSACAAPENANTTSGTANTTTATTTTSTTTTASTPASTAATNTAPVGTPATTNTAASSATANTNAAPAGDKIGVEECDDYLAKYESCLNDKVPAAARAAMKSSFEQTRAAWRKAAATPQGRTGLAQACKTAHESAKQTMGAYGCTF
ncbi:MAG TPA: hypothetical protein VE775_02125, partial [Pyrinomonadaceae bacterium]|nr:hypothetical protein [Pyrinomonadaceae bacterium]